ncbi:hypothetical protein MAE02_66160 [Microvirga aerophila]|uniref:ACT-like domain-containing protein n=1 Tax=Microvirga aerophila TaxID=670291 RepID=A0A512C3Z0_9HYPH|nr:hypothetical protein MAE02_66160 [Microvirga aerophila]
MPKILPHGSTLGQPDNTVAMLREQGYPVLDMSDNELAKLHVRYMVDGRSPGPQDELIFRFQFPERPGALLKFLNGLSTNWNISLFHYRNHGADYGRILAGIQVPASERLQLRWSIGGTRISVLGRK